MKLSCVQNELSQTAKRMEERSLALRSLLSVYPVFQQQFCHIFFILIRNYDADFQHGAFLPSQSYDSRLSKKVNPYIIRCTKKRYILHFKSDNTYPAPGVILEAKHFLLFVRRIIPKAWNNRGSNDIIISAKKDGDENGYAYYRRLAHG